MTEQRYARNIPALSEAEQAALGQKTVAVVGCGGLGGYAAELLARLGVGRLRLIDGDRFEESDRNRQLLAEDATLGQNKAAAAAERLRRVNALVRTEVCPVFLTAENAPALLAGCDAAVDALDSVAARRLLAAGCEEAGIPCVFGGIGGWTAQAAVSFPGDGLIHRLYPAETAPAPTVLSFTPALCAALQCSLCAKVLTGKGVERNTLYYFDLLQGDFQTFSL